VGEEHLDRRSHDKLMQQVLDGQEEIKAILHGIDRAFTKNDIGEPDYEGHRKAHKDMIEAARRSEEDKRESAGKVRNALIIGAGSLSLTALWEYVKAHLR
jgi:hypothetical protein